MPHLYSECGLLSRHRPRREGSPFRRSVHPWAGNGLERRRNVPNARGASPASALAFSAGRLAGADFAQERAAVVQRTKCGNGRTELHDLMELLPRGPRPAGSNGVKARRSDPCNQEHAEEHQLCCLDVKHTGEEGMGTKLFREAQEFRSDVTAELEFRCGERRGPAKELSIAIAEGSQIRGQLAFRMASFA